MSNPSPFVYWAQDMKSVFLRVDLRDAKNIKCTSDGKKVEFSGEGHGAQGNKLYEFHLDLINEVSKSPSLKITGSQVDVEIKKNKEEFWNSLISSGKRYHWLKFDFSRWKDPDGDSDIDDPRDFMVVSDEEKLKDWARKYGKYAPNINDEPVMDFVSKFYLFAFNLIMFLIHFYILACFFYGYYSKGSLYFGSFWNTHHLGLYAATALQYVDVFHGCIGLTKSGWKTGLIQVTGRLTIIALVDGCPDLQTSVSTFCLMVVYLLIEQFRYPYYAVNSLGIEIYILTWLRYSIWIVLYPSGLLLEAINMLKAIPYYYQSGKWSISLPNALNFSFNFGVFLTLFVTTVFPKICYTLITHMMKQRAKKFANEKKKKA